MSNFGNFYDPRKELLNALSPSLSSYAAPFSTQALSRRALEQVQIDAVRALSSAQGAIETMESLTGMNLTSSLAEADEILDRAMSRAFNPPGLSEAVDQAFASTNGAVENWRHSQDAATRALSTHGPDFSRLVSGANGASGFDENSLLERMSKTALIGPNLADEFAKLLDVTNFHKQMFGADALAKTIEGLALGAADTRLQGLAGIERNAVSGLPLQALGRSIIESIAPWSSNVALAEQFDLNSFSRQFSEALSREEYLEFDVEARNYAERIAQSLASRPLSPRALHEAVESAPADSFLEVVQTVLEKLQAIEEKQEFMATSLQAIETSNNKWSKKHPLQVGLVFFALGIVATHLSPRVEKLLYGKESVSTPGAGGGETSSEVDGGRKHILVVNADVLHMRAGPSTDFQIVDKVKQGRLLSLISQDGEWGHVLYADPQSGGDLYTGWVALKFTRTVEDETARLVVGEVMRSASAGRDSKLN